MWYKLKRIMMWVNGVEKQVRPTENTLYEWANGKIVHKISQWEIWLVPTSWTTIKIQDKDVGASTAGTTSASYGEWYAFANIPTAPSGYHVPTRTEWQDLMNLRQQITGSNSDDLIMQHLLIPWAWYKTSWGTQSDIWAWLYWSSTSNNSSTAYGTRFYPSYTFMDTFAHNKSNRLCVRCFKD